MIGILMLETRFPRFPGDIGNPDTFGGDANFRVVRDARVDVIVSDQPLESELLGGFIDAARELEAEGVRVIGTSCGFLSRAQDEIQSALRVPFISSSLLLIPLFRTLYGADAPLGVLTFDATKLGRVHFAGAPMDHVSVHGLDPAGDWYRCISGNLESVDPASAAAESLAVAAKCLQANPDTRALILECTNLSPWKSQMRRRHGVDVYDVVDLLRWVAAARGSRSAD